MGFEPTTFRLRDEFSTAELQTQYGGLSENRTQLLRLKRPLSSQWIKSPYLGGRPGTRTLEAVKLSNFQDCVLDQPDAFQINVVEAWGIEPQPYACKANVLPLSLCPQTWSERWGSNPRPHGPKPYAIPLRHTLIDDKELGSGGGI